MPNFSVKATVFVNAESPVAAQAMVSNALHAIGNLVKIEYEVLTQEAGSMWKPIATAPKADNHKILGYDAAIGIAETATYSAATGRWIWNGNINGPTHWMAHPE